MAFFLIVVIVSAGRLEFDEQETGRIDALLEPAPQSPQETLVAYRFVADQRFVVFCAMKPAGFSG
jgi:hypothetical protein